MVIIKKMRIMALLAALLFSIFYLQTAYINPHYTKCILHVYIYICTYKQIACSHTQAVACKKIVDTNGPNLPTIHGNL